MSLHAALDARVGIAILPGERLRQLQRLRKKTLRGMDGRYDLRGQRLFAGQTAAGEEKLPHHCRVGQRQDDLIQERREGNLHIDLGEAEESAVLAHEAKVQGSGQDRAAGVCVAGDAADGRHVQQRQAEEHSVHHRRQFWKAVRRLRVKPLQVDAVAPELWIAARQDQGGIAGCDLQLIEGGLILAEDVGSERVCEFPVCEGEEIDRSLPGQLHRGHVFPPISTPGASSLPKAL